MGSLYNDIEDGDRIITPTHNHELDKYSIPLIQKKILQRSCRGVVSIKRIDSKGEYIVIENTSIKKPVVMTNWTLRRRGVDVPQNTYKFDKHFVLHPNKSVKIYANGKGRNNPPNELESETTKNWGIGTYAFTQLVNHLNQEKASLLEKVEHYERDLQLNTNKTNDIHENAKLSDFGFNNVRSSYKNFGNNIKESYADNEFEFYFEKNIRP